MELEAIGSSCLIIVSIASDLSDSGDFIEFSIFFKTRMFRQQVITRSVLIDFLFYLNQLYFLYFLIDFLNFDSNTFENVREAFKILLPVFFGNLKNDNNKK